MTYIKQDWVDERIDGEEKYTITSTDGTIQGATIALANTIIRAGTPITAERMTHIEEGIEAAHVLAEASGNGAPAQHGLNHGAGGSDPVTIVKAQISDFPTSMTPTPHAASHNAGGSDAISISKNQIYDLDFSQIGGGGLTEYSANLAPGGSWNAGTRQQAVNVPGSSAKTNLIIAPKMEQSNSYEEWCNCGVRCVARSGDTLTFQCEGIPTIVIGVMILGA